MNRGFTLLETLIAVTLLAFAVAGPLFAASHAVTAVQIARSQLTASYLAQEGIEYVRMMRDDEFLSAYKVGGASVSTAAWNAFLSGGDSASISGCRNSTKCTLDPSRGMGTGSGFSLQPCSGAACTPLYLANGLYTQQTNIPGSVQTPYSRTIQATDISGTDERIVSTVTWSYHGSTYSVTVSDHLTPWQ